jgi:hypothetical protein
MKSGAISASLRLLLQIKAERAKRFLGFFHCANRNANCQPGVGRRLGHGKAVVASAMELLEYPLSNGNSIGRRKRRDRTSGLWLSQPLHGELDIVGLQLAPTFDLGLIPVFRVLLEISRASFRANVYARVTFLG